MLADYADALAMARGRNLEGEPFALVKRALAVDPEHIKALALAGTAEFERRNYAAAIAYWERILKVVPPDSEFARSVTGSIAEARALAGAGALAQAAAQGRAAPAKAAKPKQPAAGASLAGHRQPRSGARRQGRARRHGVHPRAARERLAHAARGRAHHRRRSCPTASRSTTAWRWRRARRISSHAQVVVVGTRFEGRAAPRRRKATSRAASAPVAPGATGVKVVLSRVVD